MKIGEIIQKDRLAKSLNLKEISELLKIRQVYLQAIEQDNIEFFSSKAYYYGYLKQYLQLLNLNHIRINEMNINPPELAISIPCKDKSSPSLKLILLSIICMIIIYTWASSII